MTRRIWNTHTRAAVVLGLLGGLVATGSVAVAEGGPRGPVAALDRARQAAGQASDRARTVDRDAAVVLGTRQETGAGGENEQAKVAGEGTAAGAKPDAGDVATARNTSASEPRARYDPARHRDPFRPPTIGATFVAGTPRTPLERYEIGQLKLVGVVWDFGPPRAMVEDSAGLGYIVTAGTPIGASGGVVRSVEPRRILIEESTTNFYGEKEPREVVMELPQEDRSP